MTEFAQALIAMGIVGTFSIAAGLIFIKIAECIVEEAYAETQSERVITEEGEDDMDYVELNGELIPYNEDDQE